MESNFYLSESARFRTIKVHAANCCASIVSTFVQRLRSVVVFQIERDSAVADVPEQYPADFDFDALRTIKYTFPASLLKAKSVGTRYDLPSLPTIECVVAVLM